MNSSQLLITSGFCGFIAFLITFLVMPSLIKRLKNAEIVGRDIHKLTKPEVAEMGGIGILLGFAIAIMVGVYLCPAWQPLDLLHVNKKGELPIGSPLMDLTHRWKKPYKPEATQFAAHCLQTAGSADMKVRRKTAH